MKRIIIFILFSISIFSKDLNIRLEEDGLNKFLKAVGSFSDETELDFKVTKYSFTWKIYDAEVNLLNGSSEFRAKIDIVTEDKIRTGRVEGIAKFKFVGSTQKLMIDIEDLNVRGLDIFNVVGFYEPKYEMPIKLIRKEKIEITRGKDKKVYLIPDLVNESVKSYKGELLIEADLKFTEEK